MTSSHLTALTNSRFNDLWQTIRILFNEISKCGGVEETVKIRLKQIIMFIV